ncbi:Fur family transcriptional regulator [Thioalkalivibrio sp. ALJT]|uniref:Fur family transcriptional regulator n=1 Tax=Thioalkalivibrio sp. ALJT TaxID=1158146 RepID=UPI00035FA22B|nr:Fur family transcriptional regulator [Thioalkalivibrio sp. ALJT]
MTIAAAAPTLDIEQALANAERVCARHGARLTEQRRRILEQILRTEGVIKAYDLIRALSSDDHSIKPPTVYRTLAFLLEQGLIHRIESLNGFVACSHPGERHESALMICDGCGRITEFHIPEPVSRALDSAAAEQDFAIQSRTVELHGQCGECRRQPRDST